MTSDFTRDATPVELRWQGPYSWRGAGHPALAEVAAAEGPGLYQWTVPVDESERIYYVGQTTRSISRRHIEHLQAYLSGQYTILDPEALRKGKARRVYEGSGYRSLPWAHTWRFLDAANELRMALLDSLGAMRIYLAPLDLPSRQQRRIEGALVRRLQRHPRAEVQACLNPGLRCWSRASSEPPIAVRVLEAQRFLGMPHEFEA